MMAMKLDHMVILVRSLDASLPWYSTLLGLIGFEKSRDHVWWNGEVAIDLETARAAEQVVVGVARPHLEELEGVEPDARAHRARCAFDGCGRAAPRLRATQRCPAR